MVRSIPILLGYSNNDILQACAVYAVSLFLPTIIKGLGYTSAIAQLLTIPVYASASISCIVVGYFSDRMAQRSLFTLASYTAVFIGFLIAVCPPSFIPGLTYAGCFIAASGIYPGTMQIPTTFPYTR